MHLSRANTTLHLPLIFFAFPLALSNNLTQPISLVLLFPFLFYAKRGIKNSAPLLIIILTSTALQVVISSAEKISFYQFIRSGMPFFYLLTFLAGYRFLHKKIERITRAHSRHYRKTLERIIYIFAIGQLIQVTLYSAGFDLTNAASKSAEDIGRIMLYPTSGAILLFFYACCNRKIPLMLILAITLLAAGSKTILAAMTVMIMLSAITQKKIKTLVTLVASIAVLSVIALYASPLAVERFSEFLFTDKGADVTREYEISHAKDSFYSSAPTIFIGNGLAKQISPGVPTNDERWFENSKFDIENGYWGLLAKLGVIGCLGFALLFTLLPRNAISLALVSILLIFSFKTSYQFFTTFDGSYLLIWSIIISILNKKPSVTRRYSNPSRPTFYESLKLKQA